MKVAVAKLVTLDSDDDTPKERRPAVGATLVVGNLKSNLELDIAAVRVFNQLCGVNLVA